MGILDIFQNIFMSAQLYFLVFTPLDVVVQGFIVFLFQII